jgi:hypothetical protein
MKRFKTKLCSWITASIGQVVAIATGRVRRRVVDDAR